MSETRKGIFIRLPAELKEKCVIAAKKMGLSLAAYIRLAISERLGKDEQQERDKDL